MDPNAAAYLVKWSTYCPVLHTVFRRYLAENKFTDIVLTCPVNFGDTAIIRVHRVILSSCSPYFETLLACPMTREPILFLKDVRPRILRALVAYMYSGEVIIPKEELSEFFAIAESLSIKGLANHVPEDQFDVLNSYLICENEVVPNRSPATISMPTENPATNYNLKRGQDISGPIGSTSDVQIKVPKLSGADFDHVNMVESCRDMGVGRQNRDLHGATAKVVKEPTLPNPMQTAGVLNPTQQEQTFSVSDEQETRPEAILLQLYQKCKEKQKWRTLVELQSQSSEPHTATASRYENDGNSSDEKGDVNSNVHVKHEDEGASSDLSDLEDEEIAKSVPEIGAEVKIMNDESGSENEYTSEYGSSDISGSPIKHNASLKQRALAAIGKGMSIEQCSKTYYISRKTIRRWMKEETSSSDNSVELQLSSGAKTGQDEEFKSEEIKVGTSSPRNLKDRPEKLNEAVELILDGMRTSVADAATLTQIPRSTLSAHIRKIGLKKSISLSKKNQYTYSLASEPKSPTEKMND